MEKNINRFKRKVNARSYRPVFYIWCNLKNNRGFALSNPNFEYWLLLHFENGDDVATVDECLRRLKIYLPNYDKDILDESKILPRVGSAITHAIGKI